MMGNGNADSRPGACGRGPRTGLHAVFLACVAGLGIAAALGGPIAYRELTTSAETVRPESPAKGARPHATAGLPAGFADLVAKVRPSVISIRVKLKNSPVQSGDTQADDAAPPQHLNGMPQGREIVTGQGSGFFVSADGYAVTNNHVVDNAERVDVTTSDGTIYNAKVVGTDRKTDLALIKVNSAGNFPFIEFAGKAPRVGDWALAVGNPFGLGGTVTAGIVSASGRDIGEGPYDDFIQLDAPINKGNSGGPSFDVDGKVMGVNTAIYSPSGGSVGIGFAIPADTAKAVIAQLKDKGAVTRGWIGVQTQTVDSDIAVGLGLPKAEGALVDVSQRDSPAAKAGVAAGDIISALDGAPLKDSRELARKIGSMAPGTSVKLSIIRNGEEKTLALTLGEAPTERKAHSGTEQSTIPTSQGGRFGLTLAAAGEVAGAGSKGVVVVAVDRDGTAAERGFAAGNIILDVDRKAVSTPSDVRTALSEAETAGRPAALIRVKSGNATVFIVLPLKRS
jgi:serine protease Do